MSDSRKDQGADYFLGLHLSKIGYDKGYWATFRVFKVEPSAGRPHGWQYSLSLHDENDDRVFGYDNSHAIDVATGPARKSKRPTAFDHIDRRGRKTVPYEFTTPYKLVEDFFADVDRILSKKEGAS
jgi:Family of unknown function (DUF6516)